MNDTSLPGPDQYGTLAIQYRIRAELASTTIETDFLLEAAMIYQHCDDVHKARQRMDLQAAVCRDVAEILRSD